jgi:hypothetical protein
MVEQTSDLLPLWWLVKAADMPRHELLPILQDLGLSVKFDPRTGDVYASRREFRELLREVAEGAE